MNSVKPAFDNFASLSDNDKKDILIYGDLHKFILEATLNYIKNSERFSGSLFEWRLFLFFIPSIRTLNLTTICH